MAKGLYMRRAEVLEETGWSAYTFAKIVRAGLLKPVMLVKGGKRHYLREQVNNISKTAITP